MTETQVNPKCLACGGKCCKIAFTFETTKETPIMKQWLKKRGAITTGKHILFIAPCPHLKNGLCDDYENRPILCRQHQVGEKQCQISQNLKQTKEETK